MGLGLLAHLVSMGTQSSTLVHRQATRRHPERIYGSHPELHLDEGGLNRGRYAYIGMDEHPTRSEPKKSGRRSGAGYEVSMK